MGRELKYFEQWKSEGKCSLIKYFSFIYSVGGEVMDKRFELDEFDFPGIIADLVIRDGDKGDLRVIRDSKIVESLRKEHEEFQNRQKEYYRCGCAD